MVKRFSIALLIGLLGGLSGCAVQMQDTALMTAPGHGKAMVNLVRQSTLFGNGTAVDIWDGESYLGSLGPGKMIQHAVTPGKHLFLANGENWSYASGDLVAGKQYYLEANIFPGVSSPRATLAIVKSDDKLVADWIRSLQPVAATEKFKKETETTKKAAIQRAASDFASGNVSAFTAIQLEDGR